MEIKTTHKTDCAKAFGRFDKTCPRCQELLAGAAPRKGWSDFKRRNDQVRSRAIQAHDFQACAAKHMVCTCFDW